MNDAIMPLIYTTVAAIVLKLVDYAIKWVGGRSESAINRRRNLYEEIDKLWAKVDELQKENDELREENVKIKAENAQLRLEVDRLTKIVGDRSNARGN